MVTDRSKAPDFLLAYSTLSLFFSGPPLGTTGRAHCVYSARFELGWDVSSLFPYINALVPDAQYYERPVFIKFILQDHLYALYPREGALTPVKDFSDALSVLRKLTDFIMDIHQRKDDIVPNHKKYKPISALDIYRLLPRTNCKECGYATCMAFAAALSRHQTAPAKCPHLANPVEEKAVFPVYDDQGNCIRTVALDIDTAGLRKALDQKETYIQLLESRLSDFERTRAGNFESANAGLPAPLTQREFQVLGLLANGATNKQIASQLHISEHTVKSHVINIFNKLGVNDRTQASVWAASRGLV